MVAAEITLFKMKLFNNIINCVNNYYDKEFSICKSRQKNKFQNLLSTNNLYHNTQHHKQYHVRDFNSKRWLICQVKVCQILTYRY